MKNVVIYANCQGGALVKMLNENVKFTEKYTCILIPPVQKIKSKEHIDLLIDSAKSADVFIYQYVNNSNWPKENNTNYLLNVLKPDAITISFPSMYFDGYFPHLGSLCGIEGPLNLVHDYFIAYAYIKGLSESETYELINQEDLYTKQMSVTLLQNAIHSLEEREHKNNVDIKLSGFIKNNFKKEKLFNQFNHPKRVILEFLTENILNMLEIYDNEFTGSKGYLDGVSTPVYPSTMKNLALDFQEDSIIYCGINGEITQKEIIHEFYTLYKNIDMKKIHKEIKKNKPFVVKILDKRLDMPFFKRITNYVMQILRK